MDLYVNVLGRRTSMASRIWFLIFVSELFINEPSVVT